MRTRAIELKRVNYHILNGDALADTFPARPGEVTITIAEAFIEGPVTTDYKDAGYWLRRARYIAETYEVEAETYVDRFVKEQLGILQGIRNEDHVYLWFEDDLFCQVNMWFAVHFILQYRQPHFFRVFPKEDQKHWRGFGDAHEEELLQCFKESVRLEEEEIILIQQLWKAFVKKDAEGMTCFVFSKTKGIKFLPELIRAQRALYAVNENEKEPQRVLREIIEEGHTKFPEIFSAFSLRAGIYGFGDLQIRNVLKKMGYSLDIHH